MSEEFDLDATRTPGPYFDALNARYNFKWDCFADAENALAPGHFSASRSAYTHQWPRLREGWCWMNPPYGRGLLPKAVDRAIEQAKLGSAIVCLIPSNTGTQWFQDKILRCCDLLGGETIDRGVIAGYELSMIGNGYRQRVLFLRGRVPFSPPIGWPESREWNPPATDSVLLEWKKRG